jgi:hypothetical protein
MIEHRVSEVMHMNSKSFSEKISEICRKLYMYVAGEKYRNLYMYVDGFLIPFLSVL